LHDSDWRSLEIAADHWAPVYDHPEMDVVLSDWGLDPGGTTGGFYGYFDEGMYITGSGGSLTNGTIFKTREGVERFLITDINNPAASALSQSAIPLMADMISGFQIWEGSQARFNHLPGGSNVLYMDGHVEFIRWVGGDPVLQENRLDSQGQFPVTQFIALELSRPNWMPGNTIEYTPLP